MPQCSRMVILLRRRQSVRYILTVNDMEQEVLRFKIRDQSVVLI